MTATVNSFSIYVLFYQLLMFSFNFISILIQFSFALQEDSPIPKRPSFTEINLLDTEKKKLPKRLVYFSDGVLEEYSTDEDELDTLNSEKQPLVDLVSLNEKYSKYIYYSTVSNISM